jgi:broad specificity phosphatase PhoE
MGEGAEEGVCCDVVCDRYPGAGESYADVMQRVKPVIIELERQRKSVVVVCHLAVQRCLYAYFTGCPPTEVPFLNLPHHTVRATPVHARPTITTLEGWLSTFYAQVYELDPGPFGCREKRFPLFQLEAEIE